MTATKQATKTTARKTTTKAAASPARLTAAQKRINETNELDDDARAVYDDAVKAGAKHADAMDAAVGATKAPTKKAAVNDTPPKAKDARDERRERIAAMSVEEKAALVEAAESDDDPHGLKRLELAKQECAAFKAWAKGGCKGERPSTINLDALEAIHANGGVVPVTKAKRTATVESISVTVVGPNLTDQSQGSFHVHAAGCKDLKQAKYKTNVDHEMFTMDAKSLDDIVADVYADQIDEHDGDRDAYIGDLVASGEFNVFDCVTFNTPKARAGGGGGRARIDDDTLRTLVVEAIAAGHVTRGSVLKHLRSSGHSAQDKRVWAHFDAIKSDGGVPDKPKTAKTTTVKLGEPDVTVQLPKTQRTVTKATAPKKATPKPSRSTTTSKGTSGTKPVAKKTGTTQVTPRPKAAAQKRTTKATATKK